jgi:hypothetical protein
MGNRRQNRPHRRNSSQAQNIHPSQIADRRKPTRRLACDGQIIRSMKAS